MRVATIVLTLALVAAAYAQELPLAEPCDPEACQLPDCKCSGVTIPGGLQARDTPQFVLLTFDDGVNIQNIETYRSLIYNRVNKNNCPVGTTFFINHEYTDYSLVNELYNQGFEIALHSISHVANQEYWKDADFDTVMREFGDQKGQIAHFANIPLDTIHGIRSPYLQLSGNATFEMLAAAGLTYDLSWPTVQLTNPGLWPYTLHYQSIQDCVIPPCPTASIPGPWVLPMVTWSDLQGFPCAMVDTCFYNPGGDNEEGWFNFILENFERHYLGNRAPFGFYIHEWYVRVNPGMHSALIRFLDMLNNLNDAFLVNANDVIEWTKNPVPIDEYVKQDCRINPPSACTPSTCGPLTGDHTEMNYYMTSCASCPATYPWLGNPLGLGQ